MLNTKVIILTLAGVFALKFVDADLGIKHVKVKDTIEMYAKLGSLGLRLLTTDDLVTINTLMNETLNEDPLFIGTGISNDGESRNYFREKWISYIAENKSFVWVKKGKMIGLNILYLNDGSGTSIPPSLLPKVSLYYNILSDSELSFNMTEKYGVDSFLNSAVFWVRKDQRRLENFHKMLQFREAICVTNGIGATSAYFTRFDEAYAAYNVGYEQDGRMSYTNIAQKYGGFKTDDMPNSPFLTRKTLKYIINND
ncbi:uncharacterized protein LOC116344151 [Contarinia nasturtii]|uniref:uncharacterized protein LOC116344151 n=1 Tax=Contarinia nasturtii TaxID=265458 RepID=UPI0012D48E6D|nr:uncharacterized protein LOC116344151 [Contarinia nasturtii]